MPEARAATGVPISLSMAQSSQGHFGKKLLGDFEIVRELGKANRSRALYERLSADPAWPPRIPIREDDRAKNITETSSVSGGDE